MAADPRKILESLVGAKTPGLQYLALHADGSIFEYHAGLADVAGGRAMDAATTLNAYSMSKTITAAAVLWLHQEGALNVDSPAARYFAASGGDFPFDTSITIRQLLSHTAGIPNPIPLRWVHLAARHAGFDEAAALRAVLRVHSKQAAAPGERFLYTNIGYWLLGTIVARVVAQPFERYVVEQVLEPLGITADEMSYTSPDPARQAVGYLEKYSLMNLLKGFLINRELIGGYEGGWLRLEPHYVNGPAFGGLIGTARAFGKFLQDQLRPQSLLFDEPTRALFFQQQRTRAGAPVPMTPGWHVGQLQAVPGGRQYFFKEGGGGGFHCTIRVYPPRGAQRGIASIVMSNATAFNSNACLDAVDACFL
jgi:CubicO group peptidase (beta-lactamase class C family)